MRWLVLLSIGLGLGMGLAGCQAGSAGAGAGAVSGAGSDGGGADSRSGGGSDRSGGSGSGAERQVVALVDGQTVSWSVIRPLMVEAVGGQVLAEWTLAQQVEEALREEGLELTEEDLKREKRLMRRQLAEDADEAARLLEWLRERRGWGPRRFEMLVRRSAGLRKLVTEDVEVSEAAVRQAYERQYGEKTVARMILVPTLNEASAVLKRLEEGESFIDLAVEVSKDSSRDQGGLLPPISPQDASFPKAIRDTVKRLEAGEVSQPVALDSGFAILRCERKIEGDGVPLEEVADQLRQRVRLRLERNRMQQRARVLMERADVTVLDAELDRVWSEQRGDAAQPPQ